MKVLVGLSGGVDSAVAAWKLMQEGHDVTCCFMRNWDSLTNADIEGNPDLTNDICPQEQDYNDARAVADHLGLKLLRADFIQEYWDHVFQTFLKEYERGRTPNPDILCNKYIKFDSFFDFATSQGFEAVATGHYANNRQEDGFVWLTRAQDRNKDQTYFLCQVPENKIARTLFPIGGLTKPEVRRIAEALRLESVASKKDSTGICFIGERNFRLFLSNYLPMKPGPIVDIDSGNVLGEHQGVLYYTVGQRKGLNITAHKGPWFVAGKDVSRNELYVCHVDHQDWLLSDACLVEDINWIVPDDWNIPEKLTAKFRYRQPDQEVQVTCLDKTTALVKYPQGIRSVTAGQEAVFYDGDRCLGGGTIEEVFWNGRSVQQTIASALNRSDASGYPTRTETARNQRKHMPEETRTGRLEHIIFQNEANSYVVASFYDESDRHSFTGAGRLADPEEEQVYELTGEEVHHPRFGRQFRILTGRRKLPDESEAIIRFLAGKAFPGIGTATARIVVDTLGEDCLEMIRRDASILQRVPSLSKARQEILVQGLRDYAGDSETYIKLLEWGVAPRQIALLQDHYQDVLKVLDENPFRPLYEVNGFGYQSALKLADALNLREDDLRRLDGLLFRNARELSMKTGSTWLSMARMWDSVQGLEPEIFEAALARLETAGALELENGRIYPFGLCSEEKEIARGIANHMFDVDPPDSKDLETRIRQTEFSLGIEYDVRQKDAIREFFSRSVLVLNGGPGTGKTTVVRAILSIARSLYPDMVIQLAAPTGRAAKRLAALSDNDARTIHSLLRWNLEENTFAKGPSDLLECQILIIDESSMIDTHLFASLILALPDDCRLLLIGDEDQLESVGPGRVFQDLIDSGRIPAVHLERIWRQSEGSGIITLAREIRDEETCTWEDGVTYLDLPEERILDAILEDVDPEMDPDRFQVLAPMYKGAAGIEAVNEALQNVFNPPRAGCPELTAGPVTFRKNDKVMLLKNMPDEDVFNGDMGVISGIDSRTRTITVDFGETEVDFSNDFLYYLSHAWCVSVHKAQGSEYDKVYCITSCRNQAMLSKKLLYTAISRAKKELILLGDPGVFRSKVRQKTRNHRMTTLKERLWEYISLQPLESDSYDSRNLENS